MKQKTRKWNPVTRSHTRVSKNKCPHESFQCGLTHSWIIKLASRVGFPTLNSDYKARILKTRGVRWRFTRAWSSTACVTGALWAKRGERGILRETSAKRYFSPPLVLRKMPRSPRLAWDQAPHWKKKEKKSTSEASLFWHFLPTGEPCPRLASLGSYDLIKRLSVMSVH